MEEDHPPGYVAHYQQVPKRVPKSKGAVFVIVLSILILLTISTFTYLSVVEQEQQRIAAAAAKGPSVSLSILPSDDNEPALTEEVTPTVEEE